MGMKDFIKYFTGLTRNYGVCKINEGYVDPETGKKKFKHEWSQLKVTEKDYEDHLTGIKSIGIQPCTDDGTARFGAIDVDKYPIDREHYLKTIQEKSLPIIPVLSKSGGLHLYVFTTEFVKAIEIRQFLEQMLYVFKLNTKTEIFPKQTSLRSSDEKGNKANGNFINLPYNADGRRALAPDGTEMSLDMFVKCIELNAVNKKQLKDIQEKIISDELKGSGEEFNDGPPCLGVLTKEIMTDDRDRFLYNYMVFAKKKYKDNWKDKIVEAARNYFKFDSKWTDDHVKTKIKSWDKETKGYQCNGELLSPVCVKPVCLKRKFGILSDDKPVWPRMSALQKINYKPTPEWKFTVEREDGETVQVHAKDIYKLESQKALRALMMEQAFVVPPNIKGNDFIEIMQLLFDKEKVETIEPVEGTSPMDILLKNLEKYIYGPKATTYKSFESGKPLVDENYAWFVYDEFYSDLKTREWKTDPQRTSNMIKELFKSDNKDKKALFNKPKRFPGKDKDDNYFPPIKVLRIPLHIFEERKQVQEIVDFEDEEDII
jgi:hypothetical protein